MGMFQGFNQASRSAAPNLLAANAADERAAAAKTQQITNLALGAASLASPFLMPAAAATTTAGAALTAAQAEPYLDKIISDGFNADYSKMFDAYDATSNALRNNFFSPVNNSI